MSFLDVPPRRSDPRARDITTDLSLLWNQEEKPDIYSCVSIRQILRQERARNESVLVRKPSRKTCVVSGDDSNSSFLCKGPSGVAVVSSE